MHGEKRGFLPTKQETSARVYVFLPVPPSPPLTLLFSIINFHKGLDAAIMHIE